MIEKTPTTVYFPFSEYDRGFSAAETRRSAKVEALDMPFEYGVFETEDPLQIEILKNYHTGCTIQTPSEWKGQIMRPHTRLLFTVTDQDPSKVGASNQQAAPAEVKEVTLTKIPRIMIEVSDVTVLVEVLKKETGIELKLPIEKDEVIKVLEQNNLISD